MFNKKGLLWSVSDKLCAEIEHIVYLLHSDRITVAVEPPVNGHHQD